LRKQIVGAGILVEFAEIGHVPAGEGEMVGQ
jgi:hypothetical protein